MSEIICPYAPHKFNITDAWMETAQGVWYHCKECHRMLLADEPMMEVARRTGTISFAMSQGQVLRDGNTKAGER